jgi:hypothetical protein
MIMDEQTKQFIFENREADIHQLALQADRFPLVELPLAIRQINGKQKIRLKVPLFYENDSILYPSQLSIEQSSSQSAANYKSSLCEGNTLVDLTGGFGVDCYFLAESFHEVWYVEHQKELCHLASHNFKVLGRNNIRVIQSESEKFLSKMDKSDWIYVDPARRNSTGKKVVLLSDCEPNVTALSSLLSEKAKQIMIKLSPMMDIKAAISELPATTEIHIISVDNECKEILLILGNAMNENRKITSINIEKNDIIQDFTYLMDEETNAEISYSSEVGKYLYEPNASIMKSGAFKLIAKRFNLHKLHINTHLYTSSELLLQFPGRIFEVQKVWGNSKKELKELVEKVPKANLSTRNYPLSVSELRKRIKLKEGGDIYLFACTLSTERKVIIECKKGNLE